MMLIALEGLDQSGKETQARHLRARIAQDGWKVHALSFPYYDTPIGREIRQALDGARDFGADVMQLLYVANRFQHRPRLELWLSHGGVVVCDRYRASSVAYGEAQGLDPAWLEGVDSIGISAGASTPEALIQEVIGRLREQREIELEILDGIEEHIQFKLPEALQNAAA